MSSSKKKNRTIALFLQGLKTIFQYQPWLIPLTFLGSILNASQPFIEIYFSAKIVDELISANPSTKRLITFAIIVVLTGLVFNSVLAFIHQTCDVLLYVMNHKKNLHITGKCCEFDYADMEDPAIREKKNRSLNYSYNKGILAIQEQFRSLIIAIIRIGLAVSLAIQMFISRGEVTSTIAKVLNSPILVIALIIIYTFIMIYKIKNSNNIRQLYYQFDSNTEKNYSHIYHYLYYKCSDYKLSKDIRMYHQQGLIASCLRNHFKEVMSKFTIIPNKSCKFTIVSTLMDNGLTLVIYLYVGLKSLFGAFPIGSILMYTNAVEQLTGGIQSLTYSITSMIRNTDYLSDYFEFLNKPNKKLFGTKKITEEMRENYTFEFKNVSFRYPGSSIKSLDHVNCTLHSKETIAVVGKNGSGKSTFIKLLSRLYDPQEGEILLNGTNIKEYVYEDYLRFFSVVFQDFMIFSFTLGENIAIASEYDQAMVSEALTKAGFYMRLENMPDGLSTQLYNNFSEEGVEISGGEAQKIAIARALYKNAPYVILDEPTAALDPFAEADIYKRLNDFIQGKGAIFISHRLSSCYFCDKIMVFDRGKLVEEGTHNQLLSNEDGYYQLMWNAQAQYYQ